MRTNKLDRPITATILEVAQAARNVALAEKRLELIESEHDSLVDTLVPDKSKEKERIELREKLESRETYQAAIRDCERSVRESKTEIAGFIQHAVLHASPEKMREVLKVFRNDFRQIPADKLSSDDREFLRGFFGEK